MRTMQSRCSTRHTRAKANHSRRNPSRRIVEEWEGLPANILLGSQGHRSYILCNCPGKHVPGGAFALSGNHRFAESATSLNQQIYDHRRPARIPAQRLIF